MGKLIIYPQCPRCGSPQTGDLKVRTTYNIQKEMRDVEQALKSGRYIQYVEPERWRDYNIPMDVKFFCIECGAMFRGKTETIDGTIDDLKEYREDMGFEEALKKVHYTKKNKGEQALKKWLSFLHFPKNERKKEK